MRERIEDDDRRGVLRTPPPEAFTLRRWDPSPALAPFATYHWTVEWDLRGRAPHTQVTLAHPAAHVVVEEGQTRFYGPARRRFERVLRDRDRAVATRLTPAGARALLDRPVASVADRFVDARPLGLDLADAIAGVPLDAAVALLDEALVAVLPDAPDPAAELAAAALERLQADRSLRRVGDLARALGVSSRSLQRLFADYVGVAPAEVARRLRLQEAAAAATSEADVDWARLAADLGYCDQAHLVRDFTNTIGTPPARYAAS
jgi:transcriptional regulator GlxA family with amidase domain